MDRNAARNVPASPPRSDIGLLLIFAAISVALHLAVGNGYGFHRDELQFLDDARHLAWGYVAYPPVTSFMGRVSIAIFGISVWAFRLPAAIAAAVNMVLTALVARELGGRKPAQVTALLAAFASQVILGSMMMYVVWDYLAWTLICLFLARLLRTQNERWLLALGAAVGLGVLSKYSIAFLVATLIAGMALLPETRQYLRSKYLYLGIALALLMALPNFIWEARHGWVSLKMLSFIHARDVRIGRAAGYYSDQLKYTMFGLPLAIAGLIRLVRDARFRLLAVFYVGPFLLFAIMKGRGYYLLPAYTPLYAAGAVWMEEWLSARSRGTRLMLRSIAYTLLLADACLISLTMLPFAKPGSRMFDFQMRANSDMREEIGWPEAVSQVAAVYNALPAEQKSTTAIIAGDYGQAGSIALYGPASGLPYPVSGINSFYYRGYGPAEPQTLVVVGMGKRFRDNFNTCEKRGDVHIPYGVQNEWAERSEIFVCTGLKTPWRDIWSDLQYYG